MVLSSQLKGYKENKIENCRRFWSIASQSNQYFLWESTFLARKEKSLPNTKIIIKVTFNLKIKLYFISIIFLVVFATSCNMKKTHYKTLSNCLKNPVLLHTVIKNTTSRHWNFCSCILWFVIYHIYRNILIYKKKVIKF